MSKQLEQTKKHNEGMYNNLVKNGVSFTRNTPPDTEDEDTLLEFYKNEQQALKDSLVEFRKSQPKPAPKPKKQNPPPQKKKDEEEVVVEKKPDYPTITNMENMKRALFNNEFEEFETLAKEQPYLFYNADYKYSHYMNGKADFMAKNLVSGFK